MPKILFIHRNFPAQFGFLADRLLDHGWDVHFLTCKQDAKDKRINIVKVPQPQKSELKEIHPNINDIVSLALLADTLGPGLFSLNKSGYEPDIIMAHSGFGAGFIAKDLWPNAKYIPYIEWWQAFPPISTVFLSRTSSPERVRIRQQFRNAPKLLDWYMADGVLVPTHYQAQQFPDRVRKDITVIHDGVDTSLVAPAKKRPTRIAKLDVSGMEEVVTYATRGMEPHRGFPELMRTIEVLQKRRPKMHVLIAGGERIAYGNQLPEGDSWKKRMIEACDLDLGRIHFVGMLPRRDYIKLLQRSDAHIYLTAPFVLSWSMLDAMSVGCPIVGSNTDPITEFITHGENGLLAEFFDPNDIADQVSRFLDDPGFANKMGAAARDLICQTYDLDLIFKQKLDWFEQMLG